MSSIFLIKYEIIIFNGEFSYEISLISSSGSLGFSAIYQLLTIGASGKISVLPGFRFRYDLV